MSPWSPLHGGLDVDILSTLKNTTTKHRTQVTMPKNKCKIEPKKEKIFKTHGTHNYNTKP